MIDISQTQDVEVVLDEEYFAAVKREALAKALRDERVPSSQRIRRTRLLLEKFQAAAS
ncbi:MULTISPECIES: hypothetical protein [unclassified Microbacterium]|uniref:hypothetical protein n=1 Tax=unclassified Microbacterium TaxID=2609290 RepID=UPI00160505AB|nr:MULTISPECIES: hypothetical protein [unclassified Microbacterium]QNA92704.1 hypothetical protein G4G29_10530 [Microbacterium sp. Se63.02b]QYM62838.1 hypothetical protein K1X59_10565 [Microbacterium sp. Se5.02b]